MTCEHKRLKCTNNVFSCLDCGAVVPSPYEKKEPEEPEKKPKKSGGKKK